MSINPLRSGSSSPINPYQGETLLVTKKTLSEPEREIEIPVDVLREIFHYIQDRELAQASMTCHTWKQIIDTHYLLNLKRRGFYKTCIFGEKQWNKYFGDVGKAPPLPRDIGETLQSPCSFWLDRKVHETHLLVLVPKTVNGKPFTLNLLHELICCPIGGGKKTKYCYYNKEVKNKLGERGVERSYWVLMTKDVIPGSRIRSYKNQCQMIADHRQKTHVPYELPFAIEAATAILTHYIKTEEALYTDDQLGKKWTRTRCQDKVNQGEWPVSVGGLSLAGLSLVLGDIGTHFSLSNGVAGVRKA